MEDYKELFLRLAEKLGWTNVIVQEEGFTRGVYGIPLNPEDYGLSASQRMSMPNWVMDDGAALRLAVDHGITVMIGGEAVSTYKNLYEFLHGLSIQMYPDKYTAVRVAIAEAVIAKLEGEKS